MFPYVRWALAWFTHLDREEWVIVLAIGTAHRRLLHARIRFAVELLIRIEPERRTSLGRRDRTSRYYQLTG